MTGAREAAGQVLYFADGHTESNTGWLEPLLSRISENRKVLVVPNVDPIQWSSLAYLRTSNRYVGAMDWNLIYFYKRYPKHMQDLIIRDTDPVPNPVMVGCAHAVDRNFFFETGAYDETMEIWGGENIEHSFRLWMCGGRVEMIPCSKVGHIFKPRLPYSMGLHGNVVIQRNLVKLAEVWMDDYKKYYYATQDELPPIDLKSMYKRKQLRKSLGCKDFAWYMKNISPDMPIPPNDARYFGKITRVDDSGRCMMKVGNVLEVVHCESQAWKDVTFVIDEKGRFKFDGNCISVVYNKTVNDWHLDVNTDCNSSVTTWHYNADAEFIFPASHNLCLEDNQEPPVIALRKCVIGFHSQRWNFEVILNFSRQHDVIKVSTDRQMIPKNATRFGALANVHELYCVSVGEENEYEIIPCDEQASYYQILHLDKDKTLRYENKCVAIKNHSHLGIEECDTKAQNQRVWNHNSHSMHLYGVQDKTRLCWTLTSDKMSVKLSPCDDTNLFQKWTFHSAVR